MTTPSKKPTAKPTAKPKATAKPTPKPTAKPKVTTKPTPKPTTTSTSTSGPAFNPRVPALVLPGIKGGVQAAEAYNWFKLVAAKSAPGTPARKAYDAFVGRLKALGIPASKWDKVWRDAVDWTQTVGTNSTGDPSGYLGIIDPADYASTGTTTQKYGTTQYTGTTTTQYSPSSASADIGQVFERELGRTATKAEIDAYIKAVNAEAAKSPQVTKSTTTTAPGKGGILETQTQNQTTTTGFDPTIFAQNFARSRPDFAESFATKNFLTLIEKVLKDPNSIGTVVQQWQIKL